MPEWLIGIGLYFWGLFKLWINTIFITPFTTMDMLWLLIPVWLSWFFAEFFQEKTGTSMGNAISNSVIIVWGSIDCARQTVNFIRDGTFSFGLDVVMRFFIIAVLFGYGITIIVLGVKGNKIIKYIARIREVTYVFAIFTPVFYNALPLTFTHVIAGLLFFPLFYFAIELIDRFTPDPKAIAEDMEDSGGGKKQDSFGGAGSSGSSGGLGSDIGGLGGDQGKGGLGDLGDFKI
jgi:uncharacterized membrane protein YgcG